MATLVSEPKVVTTREDSVAWVRRRFSIRLVSLAPWLVFSLALLLRLGSLDLASFAYDEADAILRARAVAYGELAAVGAMTSWGIPDPPLQVYLLATVARLPNPVLWSVGLIAFVNSLAVLAAYVLAARFFGPRFGLLVGLLFAVNPWAIYWGRRAWIQLQPLLTIVAMWASYEVVVARRPRAALPFFLALAAGVQVRLLAASYGPAAVVALALGGRRWLSSWSALGIASGALLSAPYFLYLAMNRERIATILAEGNRGVAEGPRQGVLEFTWWLASGLNLLPAPTGLRRWLDQLGVVMQVESYIAGLLLVGGLIFAVVHCVRRDADWRGYALLLAWLLLPLGFVAWQSSTVYLHYFVFLVPQIFFLVALPLDALLSRGIVLRVVGAALCLAVVLSQATAWLALQQTLGLYDVRERREASVADRRMLAELARESSQRIGTGEVYGIEVPLRIWLETARRARSELATRPRDLYVLTHGTSPLTDAQPAMLEAVLGPELRPRYADAESPVLPLDRPALLLATSDVEAVVVPERLGRHVRLVPLPTLSSGTRDGMRLIDIPARSATDWARTLGERTDLSRFEAAPGVPYLLPDRIRAGEPLEVLTLWPGPARGLQLAVRLVDPAGRLILEKEPERRRLIDLAAGELVVLRHELELPGNATPGQHMLMADKVVATAPIEQLELGPVPVRPRDRD